MQDVLPRTPGRLPAAQAHPEPRPQDLRDAVEFDEVPGAARRYRHYREPAVQEDAAPSRVVRCLPGPVELRAVVFEGDAGLVPDEVAEALPVTGGQPAAPLGPDPGMSPAASMKRPRRATVVKGRSKP